MDSLPVSSSPVELCYSFQLGPVIREGGRSRPIALDAVARDHGQRAVDLMMEQPGQWVGIESAGSAQPSAPRLPDIHPGTPPTATVRVEVHVIRTTLNAHLVELPNNSERSRTMWLPRSVVGIGSRGSGFDLLVFFVPPWLYRKMREQL